MKLLIDIKSKSQELVFILNSEKRIFRLARYLLAGGTGAFVNLGSLFFLVHYLGFHYLAGSIISFTTAFVVSFVLQKFWTFRDFERNKKIVGKQLTNYLLIALLNLILNTFFMYFFVEFFGFWYMLAQFLTSGIIAILSYYLYKFFVFGKTNSFKHEIRNPKSETSTNI